MSQTTLQPDLLPGGKTQGRWMVTIFNNDTNSFDEVIGVLMQSTGCTLEEASIEAWEAHTYGRSGVHFDAKPECERVADIISSIGVQTKVSLEWENE